MQLSEMHGTGSVKIKFCELVTSLDEIIFFLFLFVASFLMHETQISQSCRTTASLIFTTKSPRVPGTHLLDHGRMKG